MNSERCLSYLDTAIRIFLYILIFFLPYSNAVIESCVIPAFILFVVKRLMMSRLGIVSQSRILLPNPSPINPLTGFFLIILILSSLGGITPGESMIRLIRKPFEWFVVYFLVLEVFTRRKHVMTALLILAVTTVATSLDALIQHYVTHVDLFRQHEIIPGDRATAGFKSPNKLGAFLALVIPCAGGFIYSKKETIPAWIGGVILILMLAALEASGSRGAMLGLVSGVYVSFFVIATVKKNVGCGSFCC